MLGFNFTVYNIFHFVILFIIVSMTNCMENRLDAKHESKNIIKNVQQAATVASRLTSARAYPEDQRNIKRDGYRYYGTGSKSGNSFAPTSIHKSASSLDTQNYFVTSKTKDMDSAGSDVNTESNNYLTVYESPGGHGGGNANRDSLMSIDEYYGEMPAETGHGGGYGHYGSGPGHGGKGCNSALGLLGVLGLAAYLQNVLRNMQNGTAGRRKREVEDDYGPDTENKLAKVRNGIINLEEYLLPLNKSKEDVKLNKRTYNRIMQDIFPLLSAVAYARDGLIPIHCTHSSVCLANQLLVKHLGNLGHAIGIRISSAISKLLLRITQDERAEQIRMISKAGKMGRNGRNCLKVFPTCNRLMKLPTYGVPTSILLAVKDNKKTL